MMKKNLFFSGGSDDVVAGQWRDCRHKISTLLKRIANVAGENKNKKNRSPGVCNPATAIMPALPDTLREKRHEP
ncbi:MAG: hypothetical protein AB1461_14110 [Thermodesulfobacteriota bacterium]